MVIPFEPQRNQRGERRCGAAALTMIYRNLGLVVDQDTVWQEMQRYSEKSQNSAGLRTFHLARNALEHGLTAIPCRFREPWKALQTCSGSEIRVILNHRVRSDSVSGHFSVLVGVDTAAETVRLHDPQFGPNRVVPKSELLELWQSQKVGGEITGNVAVLITPQSTNGEEICPKCGGRFTLTPFRYIEFQTVFCPWCDNVIRPDAKTTHRIRLSVMRNGKALH